MEKRKLVKNLLACDMFVRNINSSLNNLRTSLLVNQLTDEQLKVKKENIIKDLDKLKETIENTIIVNKG